jgi:hypothetical protein
LPWEISYSDEVWFLPGMPTIAIACSCGQVQGHITDFSVDTSNRVVCHCKDCRKFTLWTGHSEMVDPHGGLDIIQVAQSQIVFDQGVEQIRCARLSQKGMFRFYADCCRMPLGNAMSRGVPLIGLPAQLFVQNPAQPIGNAVGIHGKSATTPAPNAHGSVPVAMLGRIVRLLVKWKFKSRGASTPFFHSDGKPVADPILINS